MPAEDLVTQVQQGHEQQSGLVAPAAQPSKGSCLCSWLSRCCLGSGADKTVVYDNGGSSASDIALQQGSRGNGSAVGGGGGQPPPQFLLPPLKPEQARKKCLVLDLDETLVHSSFKPIPDPDFNIEIELEGQIHRVYVRKRPGVDFFLQEVGKKFEIVVFTASLAKYADPLLDVLDPDGIVQFRLFREACVQHYGNYVKDLTHLGRALESSIIIDNSPFSYMFQPDNAIPITSWFNDKSDRQLYDLLPFLDTLANVDDVVTVLCRKPFDFLTNPS